MLTAKEKKVEIGKKVREYIRKNPNLSNDEIATKFKKDNITARSVAAQRAWITMGKDTNNQQVRKSKKKKNTYYGLKKIEARIRKIQPILKSKKLSGTVLTLCGKGLIVENQLYLKGAKEFRYDLVEGDSNIFKEILKNLVSSPLKINSVNNCLLSQKIFEAHTDKYSHAILDYVNSFNSNVSDIDMALENNIVQVGGLLCMTFCIRGCKPIVKSPEVENECANLSGAKKYLERFDNYKIVDSFTYKDGAPMMVIVLKRKKSKK